MSTLAELRRLPDVGLFGSFGRSAPERITFQRELAQVDEPLVRGRVLHLPLVATCTPEAAHEVLVTKAKSFEKSPGIRLMLHRLAGEGLFTSEGSLWRRQRKLMSPIFQPAPMHQYAETMRLVAERAASGMRAGQSIDVAHETMRIAMSVVGKALFDTDTFDEADAIGGALTTCLAWVNGNVGSPAIVGHLFVLDATDALAKRTTGRVAALAHRVHDKFADPFMLPGVREPKLLSAVTLLNERIQAMIDERRRHGFQRKDLLTRLLTAEDPETSARMSDKQVRDEAITLFVAGHETTATALAWAFYLLARHPELMARAQAEADAFDDAPITEWQPERLALLTRVFRETMRLYPPLMMMMRRATEEVVIAGTTLPRHTLVFVSAYSQHHRPDIYPDPYAFDPDRWLPEREALRPKGSYLPFSAGPRFCIGVHFAMMEGPIVLATLLRRWRFEIDPKRTITADDFATLRPKGGVPATVRAHERGERAAPARG